MDRLTEENVEYYRGKKVDIYRRIVPYRPSISFKSDSVYIKSLIDNKEYIPLYFEQEISSHNVHRIPDPCVSVLGLDFSGRCICNDNKNILYNSCGYIGFVYDGISSELDIGANDSQLANINGIMLGDTFPFRAEPVLYASSGTHDYFSNIDNSFRNINDVITDISRVYVARTTLGSLGEIKRANTKTYKRLRCYNRPICK